MAYAGAVIEDPVIGDRLVFLRTAAETDGAVLEFDLFVRPGAQGPPGRRAALFVQLELFDEDRVAGMLTWPHSGFQVHTAVWVPEE